MKKFVFYMTVIFTLSLLGCAKQSTQILGTILGHDSQPIELSHVQLYPAIPLYWISPEPPTAIETVRVKEDGSFSLRADTTGVFTLIFSGINHAPKEVYLVISEIGQQIELDAQLTTFDYLEDFSKIAVIGDFNDFATNETAISMVKHSDEVYEAVIKTERDTLAYQLINMARVGQARHGTLADRYVLKDRGNYASIIDVKNGVAKITFNPNVLTMPNNDPKVVFRKEDSETRQLNGFVEAIRKDLQSYIKEKQMLIMEEASPEELTNFTNEYDWASHTETVSQILKGNNSNLFKKTVLVLYLSESLKDFVDSTLARATFEVIEPISPLWSTWPQGLYVSVRSKTSYKDYDEYVDELVTEHPDTFLIVSHIETELILTNLEERHDRATILYERLLQDYPNSEQAERARRAYGPNRVIQEGKFVPEFEIVSMENLDMVYSSSNMTGRTYLIDFWATWCPPCIKELPYLHKAYDKYKTKGFTILSLSCDQTSDDVLKFRKGRWEMPWFHGLIEGCYGNWDSNSILKAFGVVNFPTTILIGPDKKIHASGPALRGEKLNETLSRIFSEKKAFSQK